MGVFIAMSNLKYFLADILCKISTYTVLLMTDEGVVSVSIQQSYNWVSKKKTYTRFDLIGLITTGNKMDEFDSS